MFYKVPFKYHHNDRHLLVSSKIEFLCNEKKNSSLLALRSIFDFGTAKFFCNLRLIANFLSLGKRVTAKLQQTAKFQNFAKFHNISTKFHKISNQNDRNPPPILWCFCHPLFHIFGTGFRDIGSHFLHTQVLSRLHCCTHGCHSGLFHILRPPN